MPFVILFLVFLVLAQSGLGSIYMIFLILAKAGIGSIMLYLWVTRRRIAAIVLGAALLFWFVDGPSIRSIGIPTFWQIDLAVFLGSLLVFHRQGARSLAWCLLPGVVLLTVLLFSEPGWNALVSAQQFEVRDIQLIQKEAAKQAPNIEPVPLGPEFIATTLRLAPGMSAASGLIAFLAVFGVLRRRVPASDLPDSPPLPLFPFPDAVVWVFAAGLALLLFNQEPYFPLAYNLLLFSAAFYVMRGAGVWQALFQGKLRPFPATFFLAVVIAFWHSAAFLALTALAGLSDHWFFLRRRFSNTTTGDS